MSYPGTSSKPFEDFFMQTMVILLLQKVNTAKILFKLWPVIDGLFLDLSVVNAWLLYWRHTGHHSRPHKKSLLDFKSKIANYLTSTIDTTRKSCRRPLRDQDCSTPKKRKLVKPKPCDGVCYDGIQYGLEVEADKKRCQLCSTYAQIHCSKCQVSLCLVQNRNCFKIFHTQ
ncbi:hypothetical protein QYM36_002992 [Artemia franciscana]|uniref:PiggyBac transposable element-derived protein domain-containing protein n=1 Tax=Artemia franciscana TaxID=6661 RepID=A0AA88L9Z4_ARTSF|nr:hypothetical protein QYM36_002992 [Artemia franciscana]